MSMDSGMKHGLQSQSAGFKNCFYLQVKHSIYISSIFMKAKTLTLSFSKHESSGPQFFKTITGIKSGPDAFDESGSDMNF